MMELKPCPFCGGEAWTRISDAPQILRIECRRCHVATTSFVDDSIGEKEAADAWNRRAVETCAIECNERGCNFAYRLWTLSCGHTVWTMGDAPNYCPNCGRKVER